MNHFSADTALDLTEGQKLARLLWHDVAPNDALPDVTAAPRERRQFVRSMFALIEATLWLFKQEALTQHNNGVARFTHSETALLAELVPILDSEGSAHEMPANLRFTSNVRFAFRSHARAYAYLDVLDVSDHRWNLLRQSARVRNRLMHPKGMQSMDVSDDELLEARSALQWFARTTSLAHLGASNWHALKAAKEIGDPSEAELAAATIQEGYDSLRKMIMAAD